MVKEVLFFMKVGLTKSYKGLIFISENTWAPCHSHRERTSKPKDNDCELLIHNNIQWFYVNPNTKGLITL